DALLYLRDVTAIPAVLDLLAQSTDNEVRSKCVSYLRNLSAKESVPFLLEIAADHSSIIQGNAIKVLGVIRDERAIPKLIELSRNSKANIKVPALSALVGFSDPLAVQEVLKNQEQFQRAILEGMIESKPLSEKYVPMLKNILDQEHEDESLNTMYSLWALSNVGSDDARDIVLAHAKRGNHHAINHLQSFPSPQMVDYLISVLYEREDPPGNLSRKGCAEQALASMPELAVPRLLQMLRTESGDPFRYARNAMRALFRLQNQGPKQSFYGSSDYKWQYPDTKHRPDGVTVVMDTGLESNRLNIAEAWTDWWRAESLRATND
ncbi:MAG: HEAT repeat domain-containing protein, partial [Pontiellaceae bacterium]|nr:HEAT repeat domain-containing protein [Pontiellaceae bacterium]